MVSEKLLNKQLEQYKERGLYFSPIKYTKDLPKYLLENFSNCGMTEDYYCCKKGLDSVCWQEITEEGIWDKEIEDVKNEIEYTFKNIKKYLYNGKKYSSNGLSRIYMAKKDDAYYVYIYLRDIVEIDFSMWFI